MQTRKPLGAEQARIVVETLLASLGFTFLLTMRFWLVYIDFSHLNLFHALLPASRSIEALLIDIFCIWLLISCCLFAIDRLMPKLAPGVWACISAIGIWCVAYLFLADYLMTHYGGPAEAPHWYYTALEFLLRAKAMMFLLGLVLALGLAMAAPRLTNAMRHVSRAALALFGFSTLWIVPYQWHLAAAGATPDRNSFTSAAVQVQHKPHSRLIWILLDELSYDQAFDHHPAGVNLPNLDHFRATSFSFGDVEPIGYYTDRIIPSILIGRPIHEIRSTLQGSLQYVDEEQHRWVDFDPKQSLFALARANGWSTGVAGDYNPYCRMFEAELDSCFWEPMNKLPLQVSMDPENDTVLGDALSLPGNYLARIKPKGSSWRGDSAEALRDLLPRAQQLIADDHIDFLFLHFLVPHPPGFYNRKTHTLGAGGDYLDNLVLADNLLGELMKQIEQTPSNEPTTIIVSSDHSWRVPLWKSTIFWNEEDERATGGHFDTRPVLLVHFPGQKEGKDIETAESEMALHDMITQILEGKVAEAADFERLLNTPDDRPDSAVGQAGR